MRILFFITLLLVLKTNIFAQQKDWTNEEIKNYTTIQSMFNYFNHNHYDTSQREFVFKEFIYFDYVLNDTNTQKITNRKNIFDGLFYKMIHFVDSIGVTNLDALPTRFFKNNSSFFNPFEKSKSLYELLPLTLVYFDKRKPNQPLGAILFEPKTNKIASWIIVDQGGYSYFLAFNLL